MTKAEKTGPWIVKWVAFEDEQPYLESFDPKTSAFAKWSSHQRYAKRFDSHDEARKVAELWGVDWKRQMCVYRLVPRRKPVDLEALAFRLDEVAANHAEVSAKFPKGSGSRLYARGQSRAFNHAARMVREVAR